jgi:hypothetical protein
MRALIIARAAALMKFMERRMLRASGDVNGHGSVSAQREMLASHEQSLKKVIESD